MGDPSAMRTAGVVTLRVFFLRFKALEEVTPRADVDALPRFLRIDDIGEEAFLSWTALLLELC